MPDTPILILFVIGGLLAGVVGLSILINVVSWFINRSEEKRRRAEGRERYREYSREREIMHMQRSGSEVWMNTPRDNAFAEYDKPEAREKRVAEVEEKRRIAAIKRVADESIVRVIDLK